LATTPSSGPVSGTANKVSRAKRRATPVEYESQKLLAEAGAATEILGAFLYPLGEIPADRPIFENRNSRIAMVYGTSVYHANHKLHILDVRGSESKTVGNDALQWSGSRARMDLCTSDASQP
jgi:hypothetical protein